VQRKSMRMGCFDVSDIDVLLFGLLQVGRLKGRELTASLGFPLGLSLLEAEEFLLKLHDLLL
jgi:hypothetical protein